MSIISQRGGKVGVERIPEEWKGEDGGETEGGRSGGVEGPRRLRPGEGEERWSRLRALGAERERRWSEYRALEGSGEKGWAKKAGPILDRLLEIIEEETEVMRSPFPTAGWVERI